MAVSDNDINILKLLFCGGTAGILCWLPVYPFDVIKTRLQADGVMGKCKYSSIIDCTRRSYKNEGITVFLRGFTPTILKAFPANATTLASVTLIINLFGKES